MRLFLQVPLLAVIVLVAGCGGNGSAEQAPGGETLPPEVSHPPPTEPEEDTTRVNVYFLRAEEISAGWRRFEPTSAVGRAALEALLAGPTAAETEAGLASEIPDGTRLLGLSLEDGHAVVDLSREFESGGGSLSMLGRVAQVVFTLTQFPTVDQVSFRLDGEQVDAIGGEGVAAERRTRAEFEDLSPAILVESPGVAERVTAPLFFRGTANTYEATFMVSVVEADGTVLLSRFVTATSGSGERGTFDLPLQFAVGTPGPGTLTVWEESAEDGARTNVVEIPIELAAP